LVIRGKKAPEPNGGSEECVKREVGGKQQQRQTQNCRFRTVRAQWETRGHATKGTRWEWGFWGGKKGGGPNSVGMGPLACKKIKAKTLGEPLVAS